MLGHQLLEGVEAGLGVGQLDNDDGPADVVDNCHGEGVFVGVAAGEHADSFLHRRRSRAPMPRAQRMHLLAVAAGAPIGC
jgi:hypothetical protein